MQRALREGLLLGLPSAGLAIAVMALDRPLHAGIRWAIPLGALGCLGATVGVLLGAGVFDDPPADPEDGGAVVPLRHVVGPLASWALACFGFVLAVAIAAAGAFPALTVPGLPFALRGATSLATIVVPAAFLGAVSATFRLGRALGFFPDGGEEDRPLLRREGFWLIATSAVLYLPMAGGHSLTDPWETHYGEVSREVLARSDWISTWWAQDGFFWSKPVLNFWIQALAMGALGVGYAPDAMLRGTPTPWPEWAVRVPVVLFAIVAQYTLYKGVATACGRRAGLLGGLVLAAMPQWAMLTHQTMADMPFVASMSAAMGLVLVGLHTDPEALCRVRHVQLGGGRTVSISAAQGLLALVLFATLPQIFYLASRNVELITRDGFGFHLRTDRYWTGSFGNCGLPGNEPCSLRIPAHRDAQPAWQALGWLGAVGLFLKVERDERRVARLAFLLAAFFAALSTLGKGPAGLALPVLCGLSYLAVSGRARRVLEMELAGGSLIVATIAAPWFVAMYQRHGMPFIDRLFFHDMWRRALSHVHDTNEGEDTSFRFYLWQLGYALFPFTTLVPASLAAWTRDPEGPSDERNARRDASVFLAFWLVFAFALFSAMLTKFHHYIFPALPPAAMLLGITLDRWLGDPPPRARRVGDEAWTFGALLGGMASVLIAGSLCSPGSFLGPASGSAHPLPALVVGVAGLAALWWGGRRLLARVSPDASAEGMTLAEACALVGAGIALFVVGRDLRSPAGSETPGQARLVQLFTYQYQRPWPSSLDFDGTLLAICVVLSVVLALAVWPRVRRFALVSFLAGSLVFSFWVVNVYFVSASPHWGQRELFEAYYRQRASPDEPVVAYQLNWKGENFYTSNHLPVFVSTGERFRGWISQQREKGVRTMYFVTEHRRMDNLHAELGLPRRFERITSESVNNKFGLARVTFD